MSLSFEMNERDLKEALELLDRTGANMEKAVPRVVSDATTECYRRAREIIAQENIYRTGLYSKSVRMDVDERGRDTEGRVGNAARDPRTGFPYPVVIEEGSKPHMITPTVKKALHFYTKSGEEVFAKRVMHPGTKPRRVFQRARDFAVKEIPRLVEDFLRKLGKA